jgi:hypothetical protein
MKTIYSAQIYFSNVDGDGQTTVLVETDTVSHKDYFHKDYFNPETSRNVLNAAIDQFFRGGGKGAVTCVSIGRFSGDFVSLVQ